MNRPCIHTFLRSRRATLFGGVENKQQVFCLELVLVYDKAFIIRTCTTNDEAEAIMNMHNRKDLMFDLLDGEED